MATAYAAQRTRRRPLLGPTIHGIAVLALRLALIVSALAALYLLFGLLSGQIAQSAKLPRPEQQRVWQNVLLAGSALRYSLAAAALLSAVVFFAEAVTGYLLALTGGALFAGIPFALSLAAGSQPFAQNAALQSAVAAFPQAALPVLAVAALLVALDVARRLHALLQQRPLARDLLQYGTEAQPETLRLPRRLSPLGKCWEGPFCRTAMRAHCPIFLKKKACWREKKGCYCEEEISNQIAGQIVGTPLAMAPSARYNFAGEPAPRARKAELSPAQKRERCRHCIIYNEHQRRKYALFLPVVFATVVLLCLTNQALLRQGLEGGLVGIDTLLARFSFGGAGAGMAAAFADPSPAVQWVLLAALALMLLSKALQMLEWAIFKLKI